MIAVSLSGLSFYSTVSSRLRNRERTDWLAANHL
jgi:hypothetical protein